MKGTETGRVEYNQKSAEREYERRTLIGNLRNVDDTSVKYPNVLLRALQLSSTTADLQFVIGAALIGIFAELKGIRAGIDTANYDK